MPHLCRGTKKESFKARKKLFPQKWFPGSWGRRILAPRKEANCCVPHWDGLTQGTGEDTVAHPQFPARQEPTLQHRNEAAPVVVRGIGRQPQEGRREESACHICSPHIHVWITPGRGKESLTWIENQARLANP